jgi:hypothetical protein
MGRKVSLVQLICKNCGVHFERRPSEVKTYCSKKCSSSCPDMIKLRNENAKKTFLEKYGGHPMTREETKQRHQESVLRNYGVTHPLKSKSLVNKVKNTKLERYGDENYCNKDKIKETKIEKYGSLYTPGEGGVTKKAVERLNRIFFNSDNYTPLFETLKIGDDLNKYFYFKCKDCNKVFKFKKSNLREPLCRCQYKNMFTKHSKVEMEIRKFLNDNNIEFSIQDRKILSGYELDILILSKNIAIEVNGIYWHSEKAGKTRDYHLNKTLECKSKGINLIHILDKDWVNKKEIVKSMLLSKLNLNKNVFYAKDFYINEITNKIKDNFLEKNHLQGKDISKIRFGLFNKKNNELYSIITLGKSRFDKNYEYEIIRYCNQLNTSIVGGFSKLLKYFIKKYQPKNILTYSDVDYNTGNIYLKNGFTYLGMTPPSYFYVRDNEILSRYESQKHKLNKFLDNYNKDLTESENMLNNKYYKYWTCGNYKFVYKIT